MPQLYIKYQEKNVVCDHNQIEIISIKIQYCDHKENSQK